MQLQLKTAIPGKHIQPVHILEEDLTELQTKLSLSLHQSWNEQSIINGLMNHKQVLICDALLDQDLFPGVGNIIRNEVLFLSAIHPLSRSGAINRFKLQQLIKEARNLSELFRELNQQGIVSLKFQVHQQELCPRHQLPLRVKSVGKTKRKTYYCEKCQVLYV